MTHLDPAANTLQTPSTAGNPDHVCLARSRQVTFSDGYVPMA
jgi:hypothetical protein